MGCAKYSILLYTSNDHLPLVCNEEWQAEAGEVNCRFRSELLCLNYPDEWEGQSQTSR